MKYLSTYNQDIEDFALDFQVVKEGEEVQAFDRMGDGVNYSRGLLWQSPEGNFYGHQRIVKDWVIPLLWTGTEYKDITKLDGISDSYDNLPDGARHINEVWGIPNGNPIRNGSVDVDVFNDCPYDVYYFNADLEKWNKVKWLQDIKGKPNIPYPGLAVGGVHRVFLLDVSVFWDGYVWRRFRHSNLDDDEPSRHLPPGFISLVPSDVELVYSNKRLLSLVKTRGGSGMFMVGNALMAVDTDSVVYSNYPALDFVDGNVVSSPLEADTEYWVYIASPLDTRFIITVGIPGSEDHIAYPPIDLRGRLFLSKVAPIDESWGEGESARIARIAGKIQTDSSSGQDGGPFFRHELNISLISRRASLSEAFRDYSDYCIEYENYEEIWLKLLDGYHGQIYIPEELIYLGSSRSISIYDPWVSLDPQTYTPVVHTEPLLPNTEYFIYIVNEIDDANFNPINDSTGRPWSPFDRKSLYNYNPALDMRLKPFLCTKKHDHYRLTETWPFYYSRCLGHIWTDDNGRLLYAKDISYIKTLVLNPTHFKGQAEFAIKKDIDQDVQFKIVQIPGTAGVIYVGGETMFALPETYNDVNQFNVNDYVQIYNESNIESPLSNETTVVSHPNTIFYIYLCNNDPCWGDRKNRMFASTTAPTNGYLSNNYPGTNARWIATIKTDENGKLTGTWLLDSPGDQTSVYGHLADFYKDLSFTVSELSDFALSLQSHDQLIDYLLGWGSGFELGVDSYIDAIWSDVSDLWGDFENLNQDYSAILSITDDLCGIAASFTSEIDAIDSLLDEAFIIISDMDSALSGMGDELKDMSGNMSAIDSVVDMMGSDISHIISDVEDAQSIIGLMSDDLSLMGSDIGDAMNLIGDLSNENASIRNIVSSIEIDLSYVNADTSSIFSNVSVIDDLVGSLCSDVDLLGGDVTDLISFRDLFTQEVWDLLSDVSAISSIVDSLDSVMSEMDVINVGVTSLLSEVESVGEKLESDYSEIMDIYVLLDSNTTALRAETNTLINLQFQIEILDSALRSDHYELSAAHSLLTANLVDLYSDVYAMRLIDGTLHSNVTDLYQNISALYSVNQNFLSDLWDVSFWLAGLGHDFYYLTSALDDLSATTSLSMNDVYNWLYSVSVDLSHVWDEFDDLSVYTVSVSMLADSLRSNALALSGNINLLDSQLDVLAVDLNEQSLYASLLNNWLNSLDSDLTVQVVNIQSLSTIASSIDTRVDWQSLYTASLSLALDHLDSDLGIQSKLILSLDSLYDVLSLRINDADSLMSKLSVRENSLLSDISDLDYLISAFSLRVDSLSINVSNLSNFTSLLDIETDRLSINALSLSTNISYLGVDVNTLYGATSNLNATILSLSSKVNLISSRADSLDTYVTSLSLITHDISLYANSLSGRLYSLSGLTISLNSNLNVLDSYYDRLSVDLVSLSGNYSNINSHVDILRGLDSALNWGVSNLYSAAYQLGSHITDGWSHLSNLSLDVSDLDTYLDDFVLRMQSGYIGDVPKIVTYDWIGKRFKFEDQKGMGIPIRVDFVNSTTVSINPTEFNTQAVFPNAGLINIANSTYMNINRSGTLQPGTLYYLYLLQAEGWSSTFAGGWADESKYYISTEEPTRKYTALGTKSSFYIQTRQNSIYYTYGDCIYPPTGVDSTMQGFFFKCVSSGITAASIDPSAFNVSVYEKVTDGTCEWECRYDIHDSVCIAYISVSSVGNMSSALNLWSIYHQPLDQYVDVSVTSANANYVISNIVKPSGRISVTYEDFANLSVRLLADHVGYPGDKYIYMDPRRFTLSEYGIDLACTNCMIYYTGYYDSNFMEQCVASPPNYITHIITMGINYPNISNNSLVNFSYNPYYSISCPCVTGCAPGMFSCSASDFSSGYLRIHRIVPFNEPPIIL